MDDLGLAIDKIQISGATLASMIHRSSAASGDLHGYLFGQATLSTSVPLSDSDHPSAAASVSLLTLTITSFLSLPSHLPLPPPPTSSSSSSTPLIGRISARRKTPLQPSLKDSVTMFSLFSSPSLNFVPQNSNLSLPPSIFLLLTTPIQDQFIHTHEYKAFQFKGDNGFESKSLSIVNIGPSFRSQYDCFSPNVHLPMVDCEKTSCNAMVEDEVEESLSDRKRNSQDQKLLDLCAEGYEIVRLKRLVDFGATYTDELEVLYDKMLVKIDDVSRLVEQTNAKVMELENNNMKLRFKFTGLEYCG